MDHADLISELPTIEKMTPSERIQLARQRRALQLIRNREREKATEALLADGLIQPPERNVKIRFRTDITLLEATARNDADEVRRLFLSGVDPNSHNIDGLTPLHQCAVDNNENMLMVLLDHGADVNARDTELWTPLHAAACCGYINIVKLLIKNGADLLAVNAEGNMPYDICDEEYTLDYIESEMAKKGITQEDIDEERMALERQMLLDLELMHEHGESLESRDEHGATPLHIASANGFYSVVQFLLDCGVSVHVRDNDGWQPVHAAACWVQFCAADVLELLVAYGADINTRTPTNETPLDLCEDESVRSIIMSLQVEAQRRRLLSFARDSRRMSKKRKPTSKFESPPAVVAGPVENHLVATRGAIRRLSVRDRAGVTLARLEARREAALMRSWSFEENIVVAKSDGEEIPNPLNHKENEVHISEAKIIFDSSMGQETVSTDNDRKPSAVVQLAGSTSSTTSNRPETVISNDKETPKNVAQRKPETPDAGTKPTEKAPKISEMQPRNLSARRRKPVAPIAPATNESSPAVKPPETTNGRLVIGEKEEGSRPSTAATTITVNDQTFSRHPLTLSDLKKQRAEDRKTVPPTPQQQQQQNSNNNTNSQTTNNSAYNSQDVRARFRAPSGAVIGGQSPRSRSPKLGNLRCCAIM